MNRPNVHKRWNHKFLLKEIASRVPEHAGLTPEQLAESLAGKAKDSERISAYADGDQNYAARNVVLPMESHGLLMMRRAQYAIYKYGQSDQSELVLAAWHQVLQMLLCLGQSAAMRRPWLATSIRDVAESLAIAYAMGRSAAADKIALWAVQFMPQGALWSAEDMDPRWEKKREPFARFTFALWADFANVSLPQMPPHPYESPAYDKLLKYWRAPDPQALVDPLLDVCDWHTHECMYSRSASPSKNVDFINDTLMGWPVEVHMVYRLRERLALPLPAELDHPLMRAPLGPYLPPQPIPRDERLDKVIKRACAEVPGLQELLGTAIA